MKYFKITFEGSEAIIKAKDYQDALVKFYKAFREYIIGNGLDISKCVHIEEVDENWVNTMAVS